MLISAKTIIACVFEHTTIEVYDLTAHRLIKIVPTENSLIFGPQLLGKAIQNYCRYHAIEDAQLIINPLDMVEQLSDKAFAFQDQENMMHQAITLPYSTQCYRTLLPYQVIFQYHLLAHASGLSNVMIVTWHYTLLYFLYMSLKQTPERCYSITDLQHWLENHQKSISNVRHKALVFLGMQHGSN